MKIPTLILALFGLLLQGGGQPIAIPIKNPSFEQTHVLYGDQHCGPNFWAVVGWVWTGPVATLQPDSRNSCGIATPVPDGNKALLIQNATVYQDLGVKFSDLQSPNGACCADGLYIMKFYVTDYFGPYSGYYEAKISLGTTD